MLKKVLCVVLALVLALGTFSVVGSAATASDLSAALAKLPDDYNAQFYNDETVAAIAAAKAAAATASTASEIDAAKELCDDAFALVTGTALDPYGADYYVNRDEKKAVVDYHISTDATRVAAGETIDVTLSFGNSNFYISTIVIALAYDADVFEFVSYTNPFLEDACFSSLEPNPDHLCFADGTPALEGYRVPMEWLNTLEDGRNVYAKYKVLSQVILPDFTKIVNSFMPTEETAVGVYTFKVKEDVTATEGMFFIDDTLQSEWLEAETDPDFINTVTMTQRGAGPVIDDEYVGTDGVTMIEGWDMIDYQAQVGQKYVYGGNNAVTYTSTDVYGETVTTNGCKINVAIGEEVDLANYTNLDKALADASQYTGAGFTTASYAALVEAVNAANAVDRNLTSADQAIVDNATKAVNDAIINLLELADYDELTSLLSAAKAYNSGIYTTQSFAALTDAIIAGDAVNRDLSYKEQATVDGAADALEAAIAGLKVKADYATLNDALAAAAAYNNDDGKYTISSFKALTDAVDAGKNVAADLSVDEQSVIDNAAKAITDAIDNLVEVNLECKIKNVETVGTAVFGQFAVINITVEGNPTKLRLVNESGVTYTLARNNGLVNSITDNGDGTETWNIAKKANLYSEKFQVFAKFETIGWDPISYEFTLVATDPVLDDRFVSCDVDGDVDGVIYAGVYTVTVKTGVDVAKVQFKKGANTWTYNSDNATVVEENGELTWTIKMNFGSYGNNTFDIRTRTAKTAFASTGETLDILVYAE